jgi:hypothetical protein
VEYVLNLSIDEPIIWRAATRGVGVALPLALRSRWRWGSLCLVPKACAAYYANE